MRSAVVNRQQLQRARELLLAEERVAYVAARVSRDASARVARGARLFEARLLRIGRGRLRAEPAAAPMVDSAAANRLSRRGTGTAAAELGTTRPAGTVFRRSRCADVTACHIANRDL
ncbi:MAG TPA: hypothetical protein VKB20_10950, partial [Steroidobacteraceae bacterium]|nr:hypothetical protein [Steroidobacteraceae bacterium]